MSPASSYTRADYIVSANGITVQLPWDAIWASVTGDFRSLQEARKRLRETTWDQRPRLPPYIDRGRRLLVLRGRLPELFDHDSRAPDDQVYLVGDLLQAGLLRDYQADAVARALTARWNVGLINIPMGGGKTRVAAGVAAVAAAGGLPRWLFLTPNQELARQARREFAVRLPEMAEVLEAPVASIEACSYGESLRLPESWDGILVDECHGIAAETRAHAFVRLKAGFRIGLSGTPLDRLDGNNGLVVGLCGPVVARVELRALQASGALAQGCVRGIAYDHRTGRLRQ